jgi:hypothetical protein
MPCAVEREGDMNELVSQLQEKVGLSPEQAQQAADVVADFLETKLSPDQVRAFAADIPGLGDQADKIPDDVGDSLADKIRNLFR